MSLLDQTEEEEISLEEVDEMNKAIVPEGWTNAPTLEDLKADYDNAQQKHSERTGRIEQWLENLNLDKQAAKKRSGRSNIQPKLIRKQAEWRYAALSEPFLSSPDLFNTNPTSGNDADRARREGMVLNNQFKNDIDRVYLIDEYVRAAVNEGTVIAKLSWETIERKTQKTRKTYDYIVSQDYLPTLKRLNQLRTESPDKYEQNVPDHVKSAFDMSVEQQLPIAPVESGEEEYTEIETVKDAPKVEICDYRAVRIDPTADSIDNANFICHEYSVGYHTLKQDDRYKNIDALEQHGQVASQETKTNQADHSEFEFKDKARKQYSLCEYWGYRDVDGSGAVVPIIVAWSGGLLVRMEASPFPDQELPFVGVVYLPVKGDAYGEPDGALLDDNQAIAGAVTRGMLDIMGRSANGQTAFTRGALDPVNRRKYEAGLDYEVNAQQNPEAIMHMHKYPEIPASAQYILQQQNTEAESMTGVRAFANNGITGSGLGENVPAVRGALDAASKRESGILRRLANGITKIGRKCIAMNAVFLDSDQIIRITDEEFVRVSPDDLTGKLDVTLTISTSEEDNAKAQELAFMLQTIGPDEPPELRHMILAEIAELRKMPHLAEKLRNYRPQPDPMQQRKQELEMLLLEAQVANELSQNEETRAKAKLALAGVQERLSKAELNSAGSRQAGLDFIEQESGVKQERELQLHGEQARAQQNLKEFEHELQREDQERDGLMDFLTKKS